MARRPAIALVAWLGLACCAVAQSPPPVDGTAGWLSPDGSSAYPNGTFGEQLAAASQGAGGPVGGSPYRTGPGRRDAWRVGPRWRATLDGVLLFRDSADLDAILAEVEPLDPLTTLPPLELRDNFDHAAGGRVLLTSEFPQCAGYELQAGYMGVEKWAASGYWEQETIPAASLPLSDLDVQQRRSLGYTSNLHSAELNVQRATPGYLKPFAGFRYIGLDEGIADRNDQFITDVLPDPVVVGGTTSFATEQTRRIAEVNNDLIGLHGGLRLEMWRPHRRLQLAGFLSAGVYCNVLDREKLFRQTSAVQTKELVNVPGVGGAPDTTRVDQRLETTTSRSRVAADGARVAFATEGALAGVWKLNKSTALRAGYQVMFLSGVELAENLWTAPPPITPQSDELVLHGWVAGFECRR